MQIEYDPRKMHRPHRLLVLDAIGGSDDHPKRVSVRLSEGMNEIEDSAWGAVALRSDVQALIGSGAIVVLGGVPPLQGGDAPVSREAREAELLAMKAPQLSLVARKLGVKKPESGDWLEAIPDLLKAEFGGDAG
jgi:hypothetical protein